MVDPLSPEMRSAFMARIRSVDTGPEWIVRRLLHRSGYRYRLHYAKLPGRPDLVFPSRRKAIFIHGCFWHQHENCEMARVPKTRSDYWRSKFERNRRRDARNSAAILSLGWSVLTIWECELADMAALENRLVSYLGSAPAGKEPCC